MDAVDCNNIDHHQTQSTILSPAILSPLHFLQIFFLYIHLTHFSLSPRLLNLLTVNPFFFQGRILTALFSIHISIFIIPFHSTPPSKKKPCLSCAWWIIIPSSVRPCQSINLTCHLLSFLSSSVKGWLPLLSLYLSVSLCVQIPRLSPPDWIIQFRCHLFHSWQQGLCALSSIKKTVVLIANSVHPLAYSAVNILSPCNPILISY